MSHRQSCDRCRQQKVRCLREEAQRVASNPPASSGPNSFSRCERCTKAGVDCVYSCMYCSDHGKCAKRVLTDQILAVAPSALKQRSARRSVQTSSRRDTDPGCKDLDGTTWFEQSLSAALFADASLQPGGPSLGADFGDFVGPFQAVDESGAGISFNDWDTSVQPTSLADAAPILPDPSATESEDAEVNQQLTGALSSQLVSLSEGAMQAVRRLVQSSPGRMPLTVSSHEVNVALEGTNTLTRIINSIILSDRDDFNLDPTTTNFGLIFSALACHQHLVALFRAICNAIHLCLHSKKEHQHQVHRGQPSGIGSLCDVGPSSVAQFVMVVQLLMHLINRMDRSLLQNSSSIPSGESRPTSGYITPVTPSTVTPFTTLPIHTDMAAGDSSPPCGLLVLVQDIVGIIHNEHEKLRHYIQKLQTEMEYPEIQ